MTAIFQIWIQFINWILRSISPARLFLFMGFLAGLNVLAISFKFTDFLLMDKAEEYSVPSVLYGINPENKNAYEPIAEFYQFSKVVVKFSELKGPNGENSAQENRLVQAFLSAEDNNFYSHFGLDLRGIARAFFVNILAGRVKEGASTITQQAARLKFLNTDRSFIRKAREAWLAVLLEFHYTKDDILEMYLNEIPLGHGTLGVGAAARFFFRKNVNELSWGEAALLASLTTKPRDFSPIVNPNLSSSKVRISFMKLIENGKIDVKTAEKEYRLFADYYNNLNRSPNDSAYSDRLNLFPYFTEHVRRTLLKHFSAEEIHNGGLKVYSTLNIQHQKAAEKFLKEALVQQTKISNQRVFRDVDAFDDKYGPTYELLSYLHDMPDFKFKIAKDERTFAGVFQEEYRDIFSGLNLTSGLDAIGDILDRNYFTQNKQDHLLPVEGSIISMRPHTGDITALVGGSGFRSDNQQIRSTQAFRQPGSSFKPLVYATTLDFYGKNPKPGQNITAASQFLDSPLNYILEEGDEWSPENYSMDYSGFMRLRAALESSKNSVAVRVVEEIGLTNLLPPLTELLQPTGREIPKNYSVALGTFEVTPYEITRAFTVIASAGKDVQPRPILYVQNQDGKVIKDFRKEEKSKKQILSPEASFIITSMMEDVIKKGTGKSIIAQGLTRPAAGKTGTTNSFRDAWFVGFTPELVSSVWMGYDIGTLSLGKGMAGGVIAAPVWGKFMVSALKGEPVKRFNFGDTDIQVARVCKLSGKKPGNGCRETIEEYFIRGTFDGPVCDDHKGWNRSNLETLSLPEMPGLENLTSTKKKKKKKKKQGDNLFTGDEKID